MTPSSLCNLYPFQNQHGASELKPKKRDVTLMPVFTGDITLSKQRACTFAAKEKKRTLLFSYISVRDERDKPICGGRNYAALCVTMNNTMAWISREAS
ncbi:hypothetical protein BaRGS_00019388, partial [Batillaria attramentaria]